VKPAFESAMSITDMVAALNPPWNIKATPEEVDQRFEQASKLMGEAFLSKLDFYANAWLPARDIVDTALQKRTELDDQGRILHLPQFCPWKVRLVYWSLIQEHLFELEENYGIEGNIIYIIYPDSTPPAYRIQAMPISTDSFQNRKALPESWRGHRDDELSDISGISGCIFVHASGFIGGNKSYEGAFEMARKALEM
jgi:uncharacterized UPF0160 family protein